MIPYEGSMKNRVYCLIKLGKWEMKFCIQAESTTGYICNITVVKEQSVITETALHLCDNLKRDYNKLCLDCIIIHICCPNCYLSKEYIYDRNIRHKRGIPVNFLIFKKSAEENNIVLFEKNET
ncbi:hypothetical protein DMUE_2412 [Dictyocoela muelleri]|nr:hypothetical protein DMUE_2412 [Dictyocoela muelleri]